MSEPGDEQPPPTGDAGVDDTLQALLATSPNAPDAVLDAAESLHRTLGERLRAIDG